MNTEEVVLIDEENKALGTMPKRNVHRKETLLHRGFSCFLFKNGKLLLQQRSKTKKTWPLIWSNSVCGHPAPG
ncbi:MAG: isopentenyl-diphosphate Delta-isomerase, partial [Patescibacteria group bacterium]